MLKSDEQGAVNAQLENENPGLLSTESMDVLQEGFNAEEDDPESYDLDKSEFIDPRD